jgi:hypothetical protein
MSAVAYATFALMILLMVGSHLPLCWTRRQRLRRRP